MQPCHCIDNCSRHTGNLQICVIRINTNVLHNILSPGSCYVAGQFFPALSTCPGGTITFKCTVNGSGTTIWRVNGSSNLCTLAHLSTGNASCGPIEGSRAFTAAPGYGYGTGGPSFSSTLSGPALDGTVVECFGPAATLDPGNNRVGNCTIQIKGQ